MSAIEVGTTQLTVSGTHAQPYFAGSNRTCRSESRNFKRTSHEASSGRQLTKLSSAPANVSGGAPKVISVLAATALAQKLTATVSSPTAGHSPFGRWQASNGASSCLGTVAAEEDECRASSANDV